MSRSLLNNDSALNRFKVYNGLGIAKNPNAVADYVKEVRLKKAVRKITEEQLYELHMAKRPKTSFTSDKGLKRQELVYKVQQLNARLEKCYNIFEEEGIMAALYRILKLQKPDGNNLRQA